ncbi:EamA family transporter [Pseudonocardiaceae bacterium YIM PH 21723]|nr:EamA family transporter [Pseudonocardiaceae bacterium YIM PH 21723]
MSYPVVLVAVAVMAPFAGGHLTTASTLYGIGAGVASGVAVLMFYQALAEGAMSVVSPLVALVSAGVPVAVGLLSGERPGMVAVIGALIGLISVCLVSMENDAGRHAQEHSLSRKVLVLAIGAGLAFAGYFMLLHRIEPDTGMWPLLVARFTATFLVMGAAALTGVLTSPDLSRFPVRLALYAGVLDIVANVALMYALRSGMLSTVSVLASMNPVVTVLLAKFLLGEKAGLARQVGLGLAGLSIGLLAVAS